MSAVPARALDAVSRLPVLVADASEDWALRVLLHEAHWRRRLPQVPFFTLGMAAYLDASGGYQDAAARRHSNALLEAQFLPLLERVVASEP